MNQTRGGDMDYAGATAGKERSAAGFGSRFGGRIFPLFISVVFISLITLWPAALMGATGPISFDTAVSYSAGTWPEAVTTGDFNGDGDADLAVTNYGSNNVGVRLGSGDGIFGTATNFATGIAPYAVTTGDFNRDGALDLAITNESDSNVMILPGNGDGSFGSPALYDVGTYPRSITTGDFNRDGNTDLAVGNYGSSNVSILLGNGSGGFARTNFNTGSLPLSVTTGDFNRDGNIDMATANANDNSVSILLGNGAGSFGAATSFAVGTWPNSIISGDFNRDGKTDLAAENGGAGNNVSILLGDGAAGFATAVNYSMGTTPRSITAGDFNRDGISDLAAANSGSNNLSILQGAGDGTFAAATSFNVGTGPHSVTTADFNRDGRPDLATANFESGDASVLINTTAIEASGMFKPAVNYEKTDPYAVTSGDFNRDGIPDMAVTGLSSQDVSVRLGAVDGTLGVATIAGSTGVSPFDMITGDFNRDGKLDLATANYVGGNVTVLLGAEDGSFGAAVNYDLGGGSIGPTGLTSGDFNRDGKIDLAVAENYNSKVAVLLGDGAGAFGAPSVISAGTKPYAVTVGDFNGDSKIDLAVANQDSNNVSVLIGAGNGTFAGAVNYGVGTSPFSVVSSDFNGDGKADLAIANSGSDNTSVLLGVGDGTFGSASNYGAGTQAVKVMSGDFNRDGKADLATFGLYGSQVRILPGAGDGTFPASTGYVTGSSGYGATVEDFNRDGKPDLATANYSGGNNVSILINTWLSPDKAITAFTIPGQLGSTIIDETAHTVTVTMPRGADVTALVPAITITGDSVSPASGVAHDFSSSATYTVTAEDGTTQDYAVTVRPSLDYLWTWYDDIGGDNWVLMANPADAEQDLTFDLSIAGTLQSLTEYNNGVVAPGRTIAPRYTGAIGGPVYARSTYAGEGIVSQRILWPSGGDSLEEVLGTDARQLSDHFYWPWYDESTGPGFQDWVLVANPNAFMVYYRIEVAGALPPDSFYGSPAGVIGPNSKVTPRFPGVIGGPLEVITCQTPFNPDGSCGTPADVMASQRVLSDGGNAMHESVGIPAGRLYNDYLWTWYDDLGGADWILVANPNTEPLYYQIEVGKDGCSGMPPAGTACLRDNGTPIAPGENITPRLGVMNGPVELKTFCDEAHTVTTLSCSQAVTSQRTLWGPSFEDVPGYPANDLSAVFHWTWYDQCMDGVSNWVLMANPASATENITVEVWIAGAKMHEDNDAGKPDSWDLAPGEIVTPRFGLIMGGPVEVRAYLQGGTWPVDGRELMASQRVLWKGHFNEVLGTVLS